MHWTSVTDFLAMGGYGFYVWGAFGVCAVAVAAEVAALRARRWALRSYTATQAPWADRTGAVQPTNRAGSAARPADRTVSPAEPIDRAVSPRSVA